MTTERGLISCRTCRPFRNLCQPSRRAVGSEIGAPNSTSSGVIDRLNREINAGLTDRGLQAKLADLGLTPNIGSPADFGKLIVAETDKLGKGREVRWHKAGVKLTALGNLHAR